MPMFTRTSIRNRRAAVLQSLVVGVVCLVCFGCEKIPNRQHPVDLIHFPIGLVGDPSGDFVFVANSNFNLAYSEGTIVTIDLDTHQVLKNSTVRVPGFGGELLLQPRSPNESRLYLPARSNNSLVWMDVTRDPASGQPVIQCWEDDAEEPQTCAGKYVLDESAGLSPGGDPFGVSVWTDVSTGTDFVFTTTFEGLLAVYRFDEQADPVLIDRVSLAPGAYDVATHPVTGHAYATSKRVNRLYNVTLSQNEKGGNGDTVSLSVDNLFISNAAGVVGKHEFARGMAFNEAGTLAFVAYRTPPSLLVLDTAPDINGKPANRVLTWIPLAGQPAGVTVGAVGPNNQELIYVTLFDLDQVAVVDPASMEVIEIIHTGSGPYAITLVNRAVPALRRAYVSLFKDHAVGVIELDADSAFYHQEVARIR
jgi:DNA-binding beta-propeller fold protein YncE